MIWLRESNVHDKTSLKINRVYQGIMGVSTYPPVPTYMPFPYKYESTQQQEEV
jgi:hypothetical protein